MLTETNITQLVSRISLENAVGTMWYMSSVSAIISYYDTDKKFIGCRLHEEKNNLLLQDIEVQKSRLDWTDRVINLCELLPDFFPKGLLLNGN
jgi:hypothetical protein